MGKVHPPKVHPPADIRAMSCRLRPALACLALSIITPLLTGIAPLLTGGITLSFLAAVYPQEAVAQEAKAWSKQTEFEETAELSELDNLKLLTYSANEDKSRLYDFSGNLIHEFEGAFIEQPGFFN